MSRVILGGGISGLSTAFYLSKKFNNGTVLYEASERLGGWIKTQKTADGTFLEQGARTLRLGNVEAEYTLEMVEELGISSSIRLAGRGSKNRYFYVDNKLHSMPNSWSALVKKSPLFEEPLLIPILRDVFGTKKELTDESFYDFILRRFGKKYAEVFSAAICGIYGGNAREISVKSLIGSVFEKEQRYGSVILGVLLGKLGKGAGDKKNPGPVKKSTTIKSRSGAWSFDTGMETLPKALAEYLKSKGSTDIQLNKKCDRIEFKGNEVKLEIDGKSVTAEHLYSAIPSKDLLKLLGEEHRFLKEELSRIPFVSVAVVNLEYEGDVLPMEAFGFLVPPNQRLPILGVIFDSCIFPQENKTVLTVMMGGSWFEEYLGTDPGEEYLLKIAMDHVRKILNVDKKPMNSVVSVLRDCIPQHVVGHCDAVQRMNSYIAEKKLPLTLLGNSYHSVGIPGSILSAKLRVELQSN